MKNEPAWAAGRFKMLQASLSGRPALIVVREDLKRSERLRFPDLVTLRLPLRGATAEGLCSQAESDRLGAVEEGAISGLDPASFRYVGRMTWAGTREIWLYAADGAAAAASLEAALSAAGEDCEAESDPDPAWDHYARFA